MATLTEAKILQRIEFAKTQYTSRDSTIDNMVKLLQQDFSVVQAAHPKPGESELPGFLRVVKPGRAQAITDKCMAYLFTTGRMSIEVLPLKRGAVKSEQDLCSKLESYLRGLVDQTARYWRHRYGWWGLTGGMGTIKTLYAPQLRDSDEFPIIFTSPDTREIFPVLSRGKPLYVVEQYERRVMSIREELEALHGPEEKHWRVPRFEDSRGKPRDDTELVKVAEYWDADVKALFVEDELVWNIEHGYGLIPYAFSEGVPTGLDDGNWRTRPYLASSENALLNEAYLLSMLQTGSSMYFFPFILVEDESGKLATLQSVPGQITQITPGSKWEVMNPLPAVGVLQTSLGHFVAEISRNTLPEVMWGQPRSPARSGYAEEFRFGGTETALRFLATGVADGIADALGIVLRLTEKFAGEDGFNVFNQKEGSNRREIITVKASEVDGHHKVRVELHPRLPRELAKQLAADQLARERDEYTGYATLPQAYRDRFILEVEDPALVEKQRREELILTDPRVKKYLDDKAIKEWRKTEGVSDKDWEKIEEELAAQAGVAEAAQKTQWPMPPPAEAGMMPMAPPGRGIQGLPPEVLPPEMVGRGRAQQGTPEELAELAAAITGRPPGS